MAQPPSGIFAWWHCNEVATNMSWNGWHVYLFMAVIQSNE